MTRPLAQEITLGELVSRFGGELSGASSRSPIRRLASLDSAVEGDLSFLAAARMRARAGTTAASAVVVSRELADALPAGVGRILVDDPHAHFARIARWYEQQLACASEGEPIHPTAVVSAGARLGPGVRLGAYCVVEDGAVVGEGAWLGAHAYVGRDARIGAGTRLHPGVSFLDDCVIGARGIVHSGSVIGADGFGFAREQGRWEKIPQLGRVLIGDDVEIGANCTIDRGALDDTVIGDGCKLDNLIQIAHNVRIGEHSALAGCVGVAGSAVIGRRCMIGGGAGIVGHIEICDDVVVGGMTMISRSIREPGFYSGTFPMMPNAEWERAAAVARQLPALRGRVRALERAAGTRGADEQG